MSVIIDLKNDVWFYNPNGWCLINPGAGLMRIWSRPSGEIYKDVKVPGESRVTGHQAGVVKCPILGILDITL